MFSLQSSWVWRLRMQFVFHVDLWLGFDCKNNLDNKRIVAWVNTQKICVCVWSGAAGQVLIPICNTSLSQLWKSGLTVYANYKSTTDVSLKYLFADMLWKNSLQSTLKKHSRIDWFMLPHPYICQRPLDERWIRQCFMYCLTWIFNVVGKNQWEKKKKRSGKTAGEPHAVEDRACLLFLNIKQPNPRGL